MINPLSLGWFLCSVDVLVRQSNKSIPDFTIHSMWPVWDFKFVKYRNGTCFKIEKRTIKRKKMCVLFTQFVVLLQTLLMVNGKKFLFFSAEWTLIKLKNECQRRVKFENAHVYVWIGNSSFTFQTRPKTSILVKPFQLKFKLISFQTGVITNR